MSNDYYSINYSFQVQSTEDFYNQLQALHLESLNNEETIDVNDTALAKSMLSNIGVKC